jgi:hypothetical protein
VNYILFLYLFFQQYFGMQSALNDKVLPWSKREETGYS